MNNEIVSHEGIVTRITDEEVEIKIISQSACAACHAKSACSMSEMAEKQLVIPRPKGKELTIDQRVNIQMSVSQGNKAVVLAYLIPIIILIAVLFTLLQLQVGEGLSALCSIGAISIYYFVLYLFRGKMKQKFQYVIE